MSNTRILLQPQHVSLCKLRTRFLILAILLGVFSVIQFLNKSKNISNCHYYSEDFRKENSTYIGFYSWESRTHEKMEFRKSRHDSVKLLRIYDHFETGKLWSNMLETFDVCLVSQSSIERLHWLPHLLQNWEGPLSVSVHLTSPDEFRIYNIFIYYMLRCFPSHLERTSVHIAFPTLAIKNKADLEPSKFLLNSYIDKLIHNGMNECKDPEDVMELLLQTFPTTSLEKLAFKEVYPQNHMRNIARKGCSASWNLMTDIDIIPMKGLAGKLQEFFSQLQESGNNSSKNAFVIPVFELSYTRPFPKSKAELKKYFETGDARQFHVKSYAPSQTPTNYSRWIELEDDTTEHIYVAYELLHKLPKNYEPFYVSPDDIPEHDERFLGFGFDRNSQVREASYANWKFCVLSSPFMIHWGLQTKKTEISTKKGGVGKNVRTDQIVKNSYLDSKILQELELKKKLGLL